jgi:hydroxymethylglutaryl-CoA synthase
MRGIIACIIAVARWNCHEIIVSMRSTLTCRYNIDPMSIGRLELGTETLVDKSKSTKTVLMDLFPSNTDIEGATIVNACYGGTAALLNAFLWVESDGWDGRCAIVVAADIATYARGPARPTCGVGAVAVLVGRDAPLSFDPRLRATHASHVWDFFKPDHTVEYPTVDGALSQMCYYQALEDVYTRFVQKVQIVTGTEMTAESPDYWVFHSPYNKLVQKSYARLFFLDARRRLAAKVESKEEKKDTAIADDDTSSLPLAEWIDLPLADTYSDRGLENALKKLSAASYKQRLEDSNAASKDIGNTYTASVFLGLASLIDRAGRREELTDDKSVCLFSYGSGALATMYQLKMYVAVQFTNPTRSNFLTCI